MTSPAPGTRAAPARPSSRLPVPARDRRPALAALALLLVLAGALGSALIAYRSGQRVDVLTVNSDIAPGHRMAASDFGIARVATDSGDVVDASVKSRFVGSYATGRIPAGTLVNNKMFRVGGVVPANAAVVGVPLSSTQRPATDLAAGDVVRVFLVPKNGPGTTASAGQVLVPAARVVAVGSSDSSTAGTLTVSLMLSSADTQAVIAASSGGQIAVALLPAGTTPGVDFQTG